MRTFVLGLMAGAASVILVAGPAMAADAPKGAAVKASAYKAPLLSDGHPSLEGNWTNATITPMERPNEIRGVPGQSVGKVLTKDQWAKLDGDSQALIDKGNQPTDPTATVAQVSANADCSGGRGTNCNYNAAWTDPGSRVMTVAGEPRSAFVTTNNGHLPPRVPGAPPQARFQGGEGEGEEAGPARAAAAPARAPGVPRPTGRPSQNDNPEGRSTGERCITSFGNSAGPVMLPLLYNNTYQIVQTKDSIAIDIEMVHDVRVIRMNQPHRTDGVTPWYGDSIGHWEGNTLVVETTNYNTKANLRGGDANMKVTERFTRTGKAALLYQFTVEDTTVWAQPWGGEYEFKPASGMVYEYACHEGNYGLTNILAGAREEERQAAETAKQRAEAPTASVAK